MKSAIENNDAVKLFIGELGNESHDLRQFTSWYSNEILVYLTHLQASSLDTFCYVFSRGRKARRMGHNLVLRLKNHRDDV